MPVIIRVTLFALIAVSLTMTLVFLCACIAVIAWIFRTGYRLKN